MKHNAICDYFGCGKPLAPNQPVTGMKFCIEHDAISDTIIRGIGDGTRNIGELFRFWIEAQGGTENAASMNEG